MRKGWTATRSFTSPTNNNNAIKKISQGNSSIFAQAIPRFSWKSTKRLSWETFPSEILESSSNSTTRSHDRKWKGLRPSFFKRRSYYPSLQKGLILYKSSPFIWSIYSERNWKHSPKRPKQRCLSTTILEFTLLCKKLSWTVRKISTQKQEDLWTIGWPTN